MKQHKIFYGPAASGKSRKAKGIMAGMKAYEYLLLNGGAVEITSDFAFRQLTSNTKIVIVEDLKYLEFITKVVSSNTLTVSIPMVGDFKIEVPKFIFILESNFSKQDLLDTIEPSILKECELVEFKTNNDPRNKYPKPAHKLLDQVLFNGHIHTIVCVLRANKHNSATRYLLSGIGPAVAEHDVYTHIAFKEEEE